VITDDKKSIVFLTLEKSTAADSVVVVALVPPVRVSPEEKVPEGMVIAIVVALGKLVIVAEAELVPPVIVSATEKPELEATVIVSVPAGYSATPVASGIEVSIIVH
jgi:hypothetical protein